MSEQSEPGQSPAKGVDNFFRRRAERRRTKIRTDIQRSRAGDHTIPTWVLTLVLVAMVAGFAYLVITV